MKNTPRALENAGAMVPADRRKLTALEYQELADVPPEAEWFANIANEGTRRVYKNDITEFMRFIGIVQAAEFRTVKRSHVIAWRKDLEGRVLSGTTVRRKLAALSSLFEHLCNANAVLYNPVKGVKRPKVEGYEGKTPALGDHQARMLLEAPTGDTLKAKRDRALLSTLLYHALRREEVSKLRVNDMQLRRGVPHFRVHGKGDKLRYVPIHPGTQEAIAEYLEASSHAGDERGALFRPLRNNTTGILSDAITPDGIYYLVQSYAETLGVVIRPHSLRATAATNALDNGADIAKVQEWLGHANIATTRIYDHRRTRPEDSPTFKVSFAGRK